MPTLRSQCSIAPGKVILSGEHAVVYARPGLAIACDLHATAELYPNEEASIFIDLPDLGKQTNVTLHDAVARRAALGARHRAFLQGRMGIENVVLDPADLLLAAWLDLLHRFNLEACPVRIRIHAAIPPHAGLGSSAAVLVATLHAACGAIERSMPKEELAEFATAIENLSHGRSSGLDPTLCALGGALRFRKGHPPVPVHGGIDRLWLVQTGSPASSTGECVAEVRRRFASDPIWDRFEDVTEQMEIAWRTHDAISFGEAVKANHDLLRYIGVVPQGIDGFLHLAQTQGLSGKVCGAGAIRGDAAGVLLLHGCEETARALCGEYHYECLPLVMDPDGARNANPKP